MDRDENRKRLLGLNNTLGKICPKQAIIPIISCFVLNGIVYWGSQIICQGRYHFDFTTHFDLMVPFRSGWVSIYVLSYLFWVICYIMIARVNTKDMFYRFVFSDMLSRLICLVVFIAVPTTNIRPLVEDDMELAWLMQLIYDADMPTNLFPSIHCLVSLLCFLGVSKSSRVSLPVKLSILFFAILVFASTQFTKQHYILDVAGGILVALLAYEVGIHTEWYKPLMTAFDKINNKIYGREWIQ